MWSEVAEIYRSSKKKQDINWFTEWICRPPAAFVVYVLQSTRVTPNQVTFSSFLLAAGAGAMFATLPDHHWLILAALVFELSFILDCADGQLARVRQASSPLGHLLDFLMDEIKAMMIFACVTIRLWRGSGDELYLLAGLAGLFALASGLSLTSFTRRSEYGAKPPTEDGQPAQMRRRRGPIGAVIGLCEHLARSVVHYPQYIWLVALLDRMDVYFWAYAGVTALYFAMLLAQVTLRLGRTAEKREGETG